MIENKSFKFLHIVPRQAPLRAKGQTVSKWPPAPVSLLSLIILDGGRVINTILIFPATLTVEYKKH